MRIALVSPLFESVPPKLYGGTERVVASLCRGLSELGHEVTLFASGDSEVACELVACSDVALRLSSAPKEEPHAYHVAMLAEVMKRAEDFDVIHNHADYAGFPLAMACGAPVVSTMHGRLDCKFARHVLAAYKGIPLISISESQRLPVPDMNWMATVYHGLELQNFQFSPEPGQYLAYLGRMSPEKRPDLAIEIARLADVPLKMAAKVDAVDREYFEAKVKPKIDGQFIEFVGEIGEHEKSDFLGNALGMVFPIDWPEPFGIAPVEAWACGTPVLARPFGSVPELHIDGVTGFVREAIEDLAAMVPLLRDFDRARCRAHVERNFTLQRMCKEHVDVYRKLGAGQSRRGDVRRPVVDGVAADYRWGFMHSAVGPSPSPRYFEG